MKVVESRLNKQLSGKVIYLVVCGAKKLELLDNIVQDFIHKHAKVLVFPTYPAKQMIKPDTMNDLSKKVEFREDFSWYGQNPPLPEEDLVLVCPCTFNTFIKISLGIADDYPLSITQSAIAKGKRVLIVPAFNEYWHHPATKEALQTLTNWGVTVVWPQIFKDRVTMMDYRKVTDYVFSELKKVKFHSERLDSKELESKLKKSRDRFYHEFASIGKQQHIEKTNSLKHGCYSVKLNNKWALITASGTDLSKIRPDDLVLVDVKVKNNTVRWHGKKLPSSETPLHTAFYNNSDVNAVIHSHNPQLTYSDVHDHLKTPEYIPYGVEDNMIDVVRQSKKQKGFIILRYHGEVITGNSLEHAYSKYPKGNNAE